MGQLKARGTRPLLVNIVTIFSFKEITTPQSVFRKEHTWRTINRPTSTSCLCGSPKKGFSGGSLVSFLPRPERNSFRLLKIREPIWVISSVHRKIRSSGLSLGEHLLQYIREAVLRDRAYAKHDVILKVGSCKATPKHFYIVMDSMSRANLSRWHSDAIRWWINPHEKRDRVWIDATHTHTYVRYLFKGTSQCDASAHNASFVRNCAWR